MPTVQTTDIETYYERRGDGPPIVFVHGMFMRAEQWQPQMDALSDDYTTIAYDVRGHGRTGGSDRESYSMALYAADLDALLTTLAVDRPVLCGHSMGGCIAQTYAATYPERVGGLVLSDTFVAGSLPLSGRVLFANLRFFALLDRFVRYPTLNRIQMWVGNRLAPGMAGDTETIQRLHEEPPIIPHPEFVKIVDAMVAFPTGDLDLSSVTAPTLITYGEHAPAVFRNMHPRLAEQLTSAPVDVTAIPNAGHASNLDNPERYTLSVREHLERIVARSGERTTD